MDKNYKRNFSQHLFDVLDVAGASEYVRRTRQHCVLVYDVLTTLLMLTDGSDVATYTFGSSSEGTTTPEIGSDRDTLMCFRMFPVYELQSDVNLEQLHDKAMYENVEDSSYFLMVHDNCTPLGFAKLEFKTSHEELKHQFHNILQIEKDVNGKEVLNNNGMILAMTQDERNGPAATTLEKPGFTDLDYIPAFRCTKWPSCANEFITRQRTYGFPSKDVGKDFGSLGIFLVPTGHSESPERHLQWRLSFSLQERKIMLNLNETQHKCYVLLKMMKRDFIKPVISEKSLTSYHCKTSMFFLMETTEPSSWKADYLVQHFERCVRLLREWISNGFIPSYFLPSVNLWKGSDVVRQKVVKILDTVLQDIPKALINIRCDSVGELLQSRQDTSPGYAHSDARSQTDSSDYFRHASRSLQLAVNRLHCSFIGETVDIIQDLLQHTRNGDDLDMCIESHKRLISKLENTKELSDLTSHDIEDVADAARYALPFVYTSFGSQLFVKAKLTSDSKLEEHAIEYLQRGKYSDFLSGKLKLAVILFAQEKYKQCLQLLEGLAEKLDEDIVTIGMCGKDSDHTKTNLVNEALLTKMLSDRLSSRDILLNHTATCVTFLPTELSLIPKDLQFELFRSFGAKTEPIPDVQVWYEIVSIDSKILLYYLMYRTHEKLGQEREKNVAFLFLQATLEDDYNLCHYDTANNLLGCVLKEMGHLKAAMESFRDSWCRRPEHNAAKWHGLLTCFQYFNIVQSKYGEYKEDFSEAFLKELLETTEELNDEACCQGATEEIIYKRTNDN